MHMILPAIAFLALAQAPVSKIEFGDSIDDKLQICVNQCGFENNGKVGSKRYNLCLKTRCERFVSKAKR